MTFKNLKIDSVYSSDDLHKIQEFYNTTLSNSKLYLRSSGYFSVGLSKYISKGLKNLLINDGKMLLLTSIEVDEKTTENILTSLEKNINKKHIIEEIDKFDFSELAFLIAVNLIEIKIVDLKNSSGIFHEKYGIMIDFDGNEILFSGSNNETFQAIQNNFESFETTLSWDENNPNIKSPERDRNKIALRKAKFYEKWHDTSKSVKVYPALEFIINRILKNHPIEKYIIQKNINIVYLELEGGLLSITFSPQNVEVIKDFILKNFKAYNFNFLETKVIFSENQEIDIFEIYEEIKKILQESGVKYYLGDELNKFAKPFELDFDNISKNGSRINDKWIEYDELVKYRSAINSLIVRPLRDEQVLSSIHTIKCFRTINASVPGTGKTASVIGAFSYLLNQGEVKRLVIIGPKNSEKSWRDEFNIVFPTKFLSLIDVSSETRIIMLRDFHLYNVIFINYEAMLNSSKQYQKLFDINTMIVFDEVHRIKNPKGKTYNSISKFIQKTMYRVALSGTPFPNGYKDLYNLLNILYGFKAVKFIGISKNTLEKEDNVFKKNKTTSEYIKQQIKPILIRINKDMLKIPKPNEDIIINSIEEKIRFNSFNLKHQYPLSSEGISKGSRKFVDLVNLIDTLQKTENIENMIIWLKYISSIENIFNYLIKNGYKAAKIHGEIKTQERDAIIDGFNDSKINILITNPDTLAESISLHRKCSVAIYAEMDYSLTFHMQSRDRIHRLGIEPERVTKYFYLHSYYGETSLDRKIYDAIKYKEKQLTNTIDDVFLMRFYDKELQEEFED